MRHEADELFVLSNVAKENVIYFEDFVNTVFDPFAVFDTHALEANFRPTLLAYARKIVENGKMKLTHVDAWLGGPFLAEMVGHSGRVAWSDFESFVNAKF